MLFDQATCSMEVEDLENLSEDSEPEESLSPVRGQRTTTLRDRMIQWTERIKSPVFSEMVSDLRILSSKFTTDLEYKADLRFVLKRKYLVHYTESRQQQDKTPVFKTTNTGGASNSAALQQVPNHFAELKISPAEETMVDADVETEQVLFKLKRVAAGGSSTTNKPETVFNEDLFKEIFGKSADLTIAAQFLGFLCLSEDVPDEDAVAWTKIHQQFDPSLEQFVRRPPPAYTVAGAS
ncbi:unnamed protein product [Amoebophrya sp. A120]|nr:unnamed protein product [Amoebophrya sp. A120]|eukprot:GSA120T00017622001.1